MNPKTINQSMMVRKFICKGSESNSFAYTTGTHPESTANRRKTSLGIKFDCLLESGIPVIPFALQK